MVQQNKEIAIVVSTLLIRTSNNKAKFEWDWGERVILRVQSIVRTSVYLQNFCWSIAFITACYGEEELEYLRVSVRIDNRSGYLGCLCRW